MEESTLGSSHSLVGETKGEKYVAAESYQGRNKDYTVCDVIIPPVAVNVCYRYNC